MPVEIRSATYASSYTSGTLTVARPSGMLPGDFLVVFLIAMGVHWGYAYAGDFGHAEYGNPPPGSAQAPPGGWLAAPVAPGDYPHHPPVSTLADAVDVFDHAWAGPGGHGNYGNYWSNLGLRAPGGGGETDWDNPSSATALAQWPFISSWFGPQPPFNTGDALYADACMQTITAVGRTVTGGEASAFTFTLNNPLDAEYDYRGFALCLTPNDWAGDYYDNISAGGSTNAKSFQNARSGWFPATGVRQQDNVSTRTAAGGTTTYFGTLNGYTPWSNWSIWPIPAEDYAYLADSTAPELSDPTHPSDLNDLNELILNLITYAAPTSFGDPTGVTVADLSVTPHVDPLELLYRSVWTKGSSTLMIHLSSARATPGHATTSDGDGIVTFTQRILSGAGGPIAAPYPPLVSASPSLATESGLGLALTFRVRVPYAAPVLAAIPSRLATIVG